MASNSKTTIPMTRSSSRLKMNEPTPVPATNPSKKTTSGKTANRKPLTDRDNTTVAMPTSSKPVPQAAARKVIAKIPAMDSREPIVACLRIRPHLSMTEPTALPYLEPLSDTTVRMTDPSATAGIPQPHHFRSSAAPPSSIYTFSQIFGPDTSQSAFFTATALPLVRDVLQGQNALLFAYGVTNSGKTYTVQGGRKEGDAGILPRTLDVIFNSVEGLQGDGKWRPVRLHGVEPSSSSDLAPPTMTPPALSQFFVDDIESGSTTDDDIDLTAISVDRNYAYTIWLSYAEVYNEKVYDLLESVKPSVPTKTGQIFNSEPVFLTRKALQVRPSPASDGDEDSTPGKYISGLKQFRVTSAAQAKALVRLGQTHRRVFGTLANSASSRSHALVTIRVVRGHRGELDNPQTLQVARLTVVDLAGSERMKHTQTSGERLREAGSINKSLMVLGQCMEVMRANQRRLAQALGAKVTGSGTRVDTKEVKKGLAVVPFRHSKLTEILMDFFVGDGRAVMIVNVNPYDTGYDENSHVMKFAALAREVYTTPAAAPLQRVPSPTKKVTKPALPSHVRGSDVTPHRRTVTLALKGKKGRSSYVEIVEEDEDTVVDGDLDVDEEPANPLVDALFDEVEKLRIKLFETELRCAMVEAETRDEVMREMEERMRKVEAMHARRLMTEVEQHEIKMDAKIDMLHNAGMFGSPVKGQSNRQEVVQDNDEDDYPEAEEDSSSDEIAQYSEHESSVAEDDISPSPSPLRKKSKYKPDPFATPRREIREKVPEGPGMTPLPKDYLENEPEAEDMTETETDMETTVRSDDESVEDLTREDEEEWSPEPKKPEPKKSTKGRKAKGTASEMTGFSQASQKQGSKSTSAKSKVLPSVEISDDDLQSEPQRLRRSTRNSNLAKLEQDISKISLADLDDPAVIIPDKKARKAGVSHAGFDAEYISQKDETDTGTKKKRQLKNVGSKGR